MLKLLHGICSPSSSESPDHRTEFFVDMQTSKPTIREVYEKKRIAAERERAADEKHVEEESGDDEGIDVNPEPSAAREVIP